MNRPGTNNTDLNSADLKIIEAIEEIAFLLRSITVNELLIVRESSRPQIDIDTLINRIFAAVNSLTYTINLIKATTK